MQKSIILLTLIAFLILPVIGCSLDNSLQSVIEPAAPASMPVETEKHEDNDTLESTNDDYPESDEMHTLEVNEDSAEETWQEAYATFLKDFSAPTDDEVFEFSLRDLDGSGVPELIIVQMNNYTSNKILTVYSCDGDVYRIGEFDNPGSYASSFRISNNPMFPGLFLLWYGGGQERYGYLSVENGMLVYEDVWQIDLTKEPPHQSVITDNEQLFDESVNANPPYEYTDNILEMYVIS